MLDIIGQIESSIIDIQSEFFILDAVAGAIVSLAGLAIAEALRRTQPHAIEWLKQTLLPHLKRGGPKTTERTSP